MLGQSPTCCLCVRDDRMRTGQTGDIAVTKPKASTETADFIEAVATAVAAGRSLIEQGKPKIEAAMAIYIALEGEPQEAVIRAFVDGATLTEKGAQTYWYNCRRKLRKQRLLEQAASSKS
jgi:hypothetical protein